MTAIITPFNKKLEVDYEGLKSNIKFQIENGVSGLVPLGTTGESPTISDEEREKILATTINAADGKVPVIAGVGTNSTSHTIEYARQAEDLGADALLVVSPYYNKPTQEGLYRHYEAVSKAVNIPIVVYNIQSRTGVNIETKTLARMAALPNMAAVKEASGSMQQISDVIDSMPKEFTVLSGDDNMTLPLISAGGSGVISVVSNLLPKRLSSMVGAALSSKMDVARVMQHELLPVFKAAFIETNPVPIKTAMSLCGMPSGGVRLPLCEMSSENSKYLAKVISMYMELKLIING